jgi:SpoVK/Ycf46/Vps4 family AAA+-type ATPase
MACLMACVLANETSTFFFLIDNLEIVSKMAVEIESNLKRTLEEAEKNSLVIIINDHDIISKTTDLPYSVYKGL